MNMKRVGKNSIALGLVMALIGLALSFSANGATAPVAQATSAAVISNGLTSILTGTPCGATYNPTDTPPLTKTGQCGEGLNTTGVDAYSQHTTATAAGNSSADATVAPVNIDPLGPSLDITNLVGDLSAINTGSLLDPIVGGLTEPLKTLFETALAPLVTPLDDALQSALGSLDQALPVALHLGTVTSVCTATPTSATGDSTVAPLDLTIMLGTQVIHVPITLATTPNSDLLVNSDEATQQLATDLLTGVTDTFDTSLGGALAPLDVLVNGIQDQIVTNLVDQLEPALLTPLGNAIEPLLQGTVNEQTKSAGKISVTALHLNLLNGANDLKLAKVTCGPNAASNANADADANANANADANADADANANADADANANADANADADANANAGADADVATTLPNTGGSNVLPLLFMALGLMAFGTTVLVNERRRLKLM